MSSYRVKEAYDKLASDYELNVDTKNAFNIFYERPAMLNILPINSRTAVRIIIMDTDFDYAKKIKNLQLHDKTAAKNYRILGTVWIRGSQIKLR